MESRKNSRKENIGRNIYGRFSYATSMEDIKEGLKLFKEFINEIK